MAIIVQEQLWKCVFVNPRLTLFPGQVLEQHLPAGPAADRKRGGGGSGAAQVGQVGASGAEADGDLWVKTSWEFGDNLDSANLTFVVVVWWWWCSGGVMGGRGGQGGSTSDCGNNFPGNATTAQCQGKPPVTGHLVFSQDQLLFRYSHFVIGINGIAPLLMF